MTSNRLPLTAGASASFLIDLIDVGTGERLSHDRLCDANAKVRVRSTPSGSDILLFQTPDAVHLTIDPNAATLALNFTVADVNTLTVGAPYVYQVEIDFADGEVKMAIDWTPVDVSAGGTATPTPPPFANTVKINQDYPLAGSMLYMTAGGSPIVNAQVRVYLQSDYDAGNLAAPLGITTTDAYGKWSQSILVTPGYTYTARFEKAYEFGPDVISFFA